MSATPDGLEWTWVLIAVLIIGYALKNKTEGEYESNYITCEKPAGSEKWRDPYRETSHRYSAINELYYQVSFANQRVVNELPHALEGCTVFDRNNWACDRGYQVRDGKMHPQCSVWDSPHCLVPLGFIMHTLVYVRGADWTCGIQSSTLDIWFDGATQSLNRFRLPDEFRRCRVQATMQAQCLRDQVPQILEINRLGHKVKRPRFERDYR